MSLTGKRILFIASTFFNYEKLIKQELERQGAKVTYYDERPDNGFLTKSLIRIDRRLLARKTNHYYDKIIESTKSITYDYVLIVRGEGISVDRIRKLKKSQPNAIFNLYLWDSIHYSPNAKTIIPEFDNAYSFDRVDADNNPEIKFLPLFYGTEFERSAEWTKTKPFDACFIGTIHTDRYKVLEKIIDNLESNGRSVFIYCYYPSKLLYYIRSLFDPGFRNFAKKHVTFSGMALPDVVDRIGESRAVIDVNRPHQLGLTMRSIEAVGAQRKLITTNKDIANYDIFEKSSVLIVDRNTPTIEDSFFEGESIPFPYDVREKYSVSAWINNIFNTTNNKNT